MNSMAILHVVYIYIYIQGYNLYRECRTLLEDYKIAKIIIRYIMRGPCTIILNLACLHAFEAVAEIYIFIMTTVMIMQSMLQ